MWPALGQRLGIPKWWGGKDSTLASESLLSWSSKHMGFSPIYCAGNWPGSKGTWLLVLTLKGLWGFRNFLLRGLLLKSPRSLPKMQHKLVQCLWNKDTVLVYLWPLRVEPSSCSSPLLSWSTGFKTSSGMWENDAILWTRQSRATNPQTGQKYISPGHFTGDCVSLATVVDHVLPTNITRFIPLTHLLIFW